MNGIESRLRRIEKAVDAAYGPAELASIRSQLQEVEQGLEADADIDALWIELQGALRRLERLEGDLERATRPSDQEILARQMAEDGPILDRMLAGA